MSTEEHLEVAEAKADSARIAQLAAFLTMPSTAELYRSLDKTEMLWDDALMVFVFVSYIFTVLMSLINFTTVT